MIKKEEFIEIIEELKKYDKKLDKLNDVNSRMCIAIVEEYDLKDLVIKCLEKSLGLIEDNEVGTTLSWWIYETEYGEKLRFIRMGKKKFNLNTAGKLYDFLIKYEVEEK